MPQALYDDAFAILPKLRHGKDYVAKHFTTDETGKLVRKTTVDDPTSWTTMSHLTPGLSDADVD